MRFANLKANAIAIIFMHSIHGRLIYLSMLKYHVNNLIHSSNHVYTPRILLSFQTNHSILLSISFSSFISFSPTVPTTSHYILRFHYISNVSFSIYHFQFFHISFPYTISMVQSMFMAYRVGSLVSCTWHMYLILGNLSCIKEFFASGSWH